MHLVDSDAEGGPVKDVAPDGLHLVHDEHRHAAVEDAVLSSA